MRLDDRFLDELKSRVTLSDLVRRSVTLKKAGREWVGLSPFGKEKTPSFFVNDEKRFWHDFSSGKSGDAIDWLVEGERLTFREAVDRLAADVGMTVPTDAPKDREQEQRRRSLQDWVELAARWCEDTLRRPAGASARAYLEGRGLAPDVWPRFRIGYAPAGRSELLNALVARGARPADLVEAGLCIQPDDGSAPYDRFRDRLMFPITDARGAVVSFGARAMAAGERAKYLNGSASPIFDKGSMLYGLPGARKLLKPDDALVVVEGYMDVVACQLADVPAVAPMGTSLTDEQLDLLWKVSPSPVLCFDGDGAGRRAAYRAVDRALPRIGPARSLRFVLLDQGRDPDDLRRQRGDGALRSMLSSPRPMVDVLFERERDEADLRTPEGRAALRARLRTVAETVEDRDTAREYRNSLWTRFADLSQAAYEARRGGRHAQPALAGANDALVRAAESLPSAPDPLRAALVAWAIDHPEHVEMAYETAAQPVGDVRLDAVMGVVLSAVVSGAPPREKLEKEGHRPFLVELERSGAMAGLPLGGEGGYVVWSTALAGVTRLEQLSRSLDQAADPAARMTLSRDRAALDRSLRTGSLWSPE